MTSMSRGEAVRPQASASDGAAFGLARTLFAAAARHWAARAARRDLAERPAWLLRDIGITHGEIGDAVAGRRKTRRPWVVSFR